MQNIERTAKQIKDSLKAVGNDILSEGSSVAGSIDYIELISRFGINMIAVFILIRLIYYPNHKNKDFLFTFFVFNFVIFTLLSTTKLKPGFAFGLLAIFSIMRYRTVTVPIKEMGYFFICLALGMINALSIVDVPSDWTSWLIMITCNVLILVLTLVLDHYINLTHENVKEITYERVDLITPDKRELLMSDLKERTGLPIHRIEIRNINFLRDTVKVLVFYNAKENESRLAVTGDDD
jgi:hypothetical protein